MQSPGLTSVIIPVFNDATGVSRTLEGLSRQSWPMESIEVIVVDNGSEEPVRLPAQYPFPVHVIRHEIPGSYAARNAGAQLARGDYLAFTDADCEPAADWLHNGHAAMREQGGNHIIGGEVILNHPKRPSAVAMYQLMTGFGQEANVLEKGFSATANLFCSRKLFNLVGPFEERLLSGGDREWCWRAAKHGILVKYAPNVVVCTNPRTSLGSAIRQARRVAAGRRSLHQLGLTHIGQRALAKQRTAFESIRWILFNQSLAPIDRLRVLLAAALIHAAAVVERLRLALGARPERV